MHAFLITGTDENDRTSVVESLLKLWQVHPADRHELTESGSSIGIAETKSFLSLLKLTPMLSEYAVGIIRHAHLMTPEAQNSLLKILEEPSPRCRFIICSPETERMLPTVVSRCFVKPAPRKALPAVDPKVSLLLEELPHLSEGQLLAKTDTIAATREDSRTFMVNALISLHQSFSASQSDRSGNISYQDKAVQAHKLLRGLSYLEANVNPKSCLDMVFLNLSEGDWTSVTAVL